MKFRMMWISTLLMACVSMPRNPAIVDISVDSPSTATTSPIMDTTLYNQVLSRAAALPACTGHVGEASQPGPPSFVILDRSRTDTLSARISWPKAIVAGPQLAPITYGVMLTWFRHVQPGYYPQVPIWRKAYTEGIDSLSDSIRVVIIDGHGADSIGFEVFPRHCGAGNPGVPTIITY